MASDKGVLIFPMLDGGRKNSPTAIEVGSAGKEHTEDRLGNYFAWHEVHGL